MGAAVALDVFGSFLFQHIHDVIHCNNAKKPLLVVNHGQSQEVVTQEQLRRFFLICIGADRDEFGFHQVYDQRVWGS